MTAPFELLEKAGSAVLAKFTVLICYRYFIRTFNYMATTIELAYPSLETNFISFLCESQDPSFGEVGGGLDPLPSPPGSATDENRYLETRP